MSVLVAIAALLVAVLFLLGMEMGTAGAAPAPSGSEYVAIDGPLGYRERAVPGIGSMSQEETAEQAALLALAPDGWNLISLAVDAGYPLPYTRAQGPPAFSGGTEWLADDIPVAISGGMGGFEPPAPFGYPVNDETMWNGGNRILIFHTDDTISRLAHDVCEPRPFGVISGMMDGYWFQCGEPDWGTFSVVVHPPDPQSAIQHLIDQVEALNLRNGIANSLDAKLANAVKALDDVNDNNNVSAINRLEAFINEVLAQAPDNIPQTDADALVAAAEAIIDLLT